MNNGSQYSLGFHRFYCIWSWISLILLIMSMLTDNTVAFNGPRIVAIIIDIVIFISLILKSIGLSSFKQYAYYALFVYEFARIMMSAYMLYTDLNGTSVLGDAIVIGLCAYVLYYYSCRKQLFFGTDHAEPQTRSSYRPSRAASYCRRCGNPLMADDVYCSKCGTKVN